MTRDFNDVWEGIQPGDFVRFRPEYRNYESINSWLAVDGQTASREAIIREASAVYEVVRCAWHTTTVIEEEQEDATPVLVLKIGSRSIWTDPCCAPENVELVSGIEALAAYDD